MSYIIYQLLRIFLIAVILFYAPSLQAGTTGKIVGEVIDADTGDPLAGAQVRIEGTRTGTLTDNEGHYFLLDIHPGTYSVTSSLIGHQQVSKSEVEVFVDGTTRVDFQLGTQVLEMPTVTITAERPLLRKDITSSIKVVPDRKIKSLPVDRLEDIGFVMDANNELHIRGGRSGEVAYLIDGIPVENSLFGETNSLINDDAIEQLLILTGTFSAEYGDAMSGVVNVVTKEGADDFHGNLEYKSTMINDSPYREKDWAGEGTDYRRDPTTNKSLYYAPDVFDKDLWFPLPGTFSASLSGPVIGLKNMNFYIATRSNKENDHLPFGYHLEEDLTWKLSYLAGMGKKLTVLGQNSQNEFQDYQHRWKYLPENSVINFETSDRVGIIWKQNVSNNLFYTVLGSYERQHSDITVGAKSPEEYVKPTDPDRAFGFYYKGGDDDLFRRSRLTTTLAKTDFTFQRGKRHEVKTGGEFKFHDISLFELDEPWLDRVERYNIRPLEGGVYLQDKIEYDFFVLNAGLRFDFVDPRTTMWSDFENPESQLIDVPMKSQLSPRIGLSHPITDKSIIYFSYGHFFQNPQYDLFYSDSRNLTPDNLDDLTTGMVGNRDIKPKKTVAYEIGVKQEITEDLGLGITAFFKDINNMIGQEFVRITTEQSSYEYFYFTNIDYANIKGMEMTLDRRYNNHFAFDLNYTYSIAKGNYSFPRQAFWNVYWGVQEENQDYFLEFDRRHVISGDVTLDSEDWEGPEVLGFHPLANTSFSAIVQYSSGFPYTPYSDLTDIQAEINSARQPWTGTVDLNIYKNLWNDTFKQTIFVEITNLFNRRNVLQVSTRTGEVWSIPAGQESEREVRDLTFNPDDVGLPRIVRLGMKISF
jgi:outer membrane receptor protein involved in Fe transport